MKKYKMVMTIAILLVFLFTASASVMAYSKDFSFDISSSLKGKTKHSLENKRTYVTATAETYGNHGKVIDEKSDYSVKLVRPLKTYKTLGNMTARGDSQIRTFGRVTENNYTVTITKLDFTGYASRVKGSGKITQ